VLVVLVRRQPSRLREWFDRNTEWWLFVDSEVARLVKTAPDTGDAAHPACDPRSRSPFSRRRYVLTSPYWSAPTRIFSGLLLWRVAEVGQSVA
jgi:hypothetical protein